MKRYLFRQANIIAQYKNLDSKRSRQASSPFSKTVIKGSISLKPENRIFHISLQVSQWLKMKWDQPNQKWLRKGYETMPIPTRDHLRPWNQGLDNPERRTPLHHSTIAALCW